MAKKKSSESKAKEQEEPDKKLSPTFSFLIVVGAIILIFVATLLVSRFFLTENYSYNGFEFVKRGNFWVIEIQKGAQPYHIELYYHPSELEDLVVEKNIEDIILDNHPSKVYITLNPRLSSTAVIAGTEIAKILGERNHIFNIPTSGALTEPSNNQPVITCENATGQTSVIWIKTGPNNIIYSEDECIIIQGSDSNETIRLADRFVYGLL